MSVHYGDQFQDSGEKADLDLHCSQRLHGSVQTTVYLFETSDATKQICPMTFTLVMAGTLDPLIHVFVGLCRRMVQSYTRGIVTEMAYVSVTNIQMPCGDHETQSRSGYASPLSSN